MYVQLCKLIMCRHTHSYKFIHMTYIVTSQHNARVRSRSSRQRRREVASRGMLFSRISGCTEVTVSVDTVDILLTSQDIPTTEQEAQPFRDCCLNR